MNYGQRIKQMRLEFKMTQTELAERFGLGQRAIAYYENCDREPDYAVLCDIADFFKCSIDYLLGRTNNKNETLVPPEKGQVLITKAYDANVSIEELEAYIEARKKIQNT